jgi:hypothetical protein
MMVDASRAALRKRMDELARQHAEMHNERIKAELEALSRQLAGCQPTKANIKRSRIKINGLVDRF